MHVGRTVFAELKTIEFGGSIDRENEETANRCDTNRCLAHHQGRKMGANTPVSSVIQALGVEVSTPYWTTERKNTPATNLSCSKTCNRQSTPPPSHKMECKIELVVEKEKGEIKDGRE